MNGIMDLYFLLISFFIFTYFVYRKNYLKSAFMILPITFLTLLIKDYLKYGELKDGEVDILSAFSIIFVLIFIILLIVDFIKFIVKIKMNNG